ncbi:TonB family protein [Sphingomonas kyungheensis]|uniref:TonB family protein n=1 Tax=Sphingomonas kyungheensis TaxID=1069987 RepID=A0ABU8H1C9_9SPHN
MIPLLAAALLPTVPPAPPIESNRQALLRWVMSPVLCHGGERVVAERVVRAADPQAAMVSSGMPALTPVAIDFRIDAAGRPLSITPVRAGWRAYGEDVVPALAAARFAAGVERARCTVTFTPHVEPLATAPVAELIAYAATTPNMPREMWAKLLPAGADCSDPEPEVLLRAFPSFKSLPAQPGYVSTTMVGYDIAANGKPVRPHPIVASGSPALDAAALTAVSRSRFERGARHGCAFRYWKGATPLAAPPAPEEASVRPADATCPLTHEYERKPVLRYPAAYNRRTIEGWAIIAFDVASWGQTGNIRVLASEPSTDFAEAATQMVRGVTMPPSPHGYTGCIERVFYRIRKPGERPNAADPLPPVLY